MPTTTSPPRFGIMTAPQQVGYHDVLRVWREADTIPEIEHAWLFDHLMPIAGDLDGPVHEGWTLPAALAARTRRLRLGVLVTSNRFRPPAGPTLRVAAEHADLWNIPGGDIDDVVSRSALLDRYCAEIGRDPASVTRSIHLPVSYDRPGPVRDAIGEAIDAGFRHIVLGLPAPYPAGVARWIADELILRTVERKAP
ncbi:hypothetical protein AB0O28_08890 [Microbispora sp. NPDC088329]|uniref:hypothetical protein n=1 Tax=Microbispora sp. NPDC088329 TaxID=3154869 RepID=UPI003430FB73